jgi:outer membrane protein TolC
VERARREREVARVAAERERPRPGAGLNVAASGSGTLQGPKITFPERDEDATVVPRRRLKLELTAEQVLYRAGRGLAASRATASEGNAELQLRRVEGEVRLAVVRAFYGVLGAQTVAETARRGAERARAALRRVEALLERGRATEGERLQADAESAEAEREVRAAERQIALAEAEFNRVVGRPMGVPVTIVSSPDVSLSPLLTQEEALRIALASRPDVLAMRRQVEAAEIGAALARLGRRPVVKASGGYALQTPSAFVARSSWMASVLVSVPIWDGGRTRGDTAEARAQAASAREALTELEGAVALEVLKARLAVLDAHDRIETTRRATAAAAELHRATEERLGFGRATALELVTARSALRRAELAEARARYDLHVAQAELQFASGQE